jgi:hypothetical protein
LRPADAQRERLSGDVIMEMKAFAAASSVEVFATAAA